MARTVETQTVTLQDGREIEIRLRDNGQVRIAATTQQELAQDCGLSVETVTELLTKGWSYVTTLDQPPRWDHPIARMEIEKECSNGV